MLEVKCFSETSADFHRTHVNISQKIQIFGGTALRISDPKYYERFQDAHFKLNSNGTFLWCNRNAVINFRNVYRFIPAIFVRDIQIHCL
jgi:hypothetical protein